VVAANAYLIIRSTFVDVNPKFATPQAALQTLLDAARKDGKDTVTQVFVCFSDKSRSTIRTLARRWEKDPATGFDYIGGILARIREAKAIEAGQPRIEEDKATLELKLDGTSAIARFVRQGGGVWKVSKMDVGLPDLDEWTKRLEAPPSAR
jgi:hypothetical protein